jgi:hypothetical protein
VARLEVGERGDAGPEGVGLVGELADRDPHGAPFQ